MISLRQLLDVCSRLNKSGVRYVVVGGWAVFLHGYERTTHDIDLIVDTSAENISKLKDALSDLLPDATGEMNLDDVSKNTVVRMAGDEIIIDLISSVGDIGFEKLIEHIIEEEIDGVKVPFADAVAMLDLKRGVRDTDKRDYLFLKGKLEYLSKQMNRKKS